MSLALITLLVISSVSLFIHTKNADSSPTAPGVAVALLAAAAGIASVRTNNSFEKIVWSSIFAFLLWIEVKAISRDRTDSETKQVKMFDMQTRSFNQLSGQANKNFQKITSNLEAQLDKTNASLHETRISIKLVKQSILDITGGDSFAYVIPKPIIISNPPQRHSPCGTMPLIFITEAIIHLLACM